VHDFVAAATKDALLEASVQRSAERGVECAKRCGKFGCRWKEYGDEWSLEGGPIDAACCELHVREL
jgi:hypothetical protein